MKRYPLFLVLLMTLSVIPLNFNSAVHAQGGGSNDLVILNDSTPGIDVIVNPAVDTTGVVSLDITDASVMITDAVGNLVFEAADQNLTGIEFRFAPNAGAHTITIQRLNGATEGFVRIQALPEMVMMPTLEFVSNTALTTNQEADFPLNANSPSSVVNMSVPADESQAITATFPGAPVTVQLVNTDAGTALATLSGSLIDGVRFTVSTGNYQMTMLNNNIDRPTVANVSMTPPMNSDFVDMVLAARGEPSNIAGTVPTNSSAPASTCAMTIGVSAGNVRSGPGAGYSVLEYVFRGEEVPVGGISSQSGWLLIQTGSGGTGWVANDLGILTGGCDSLVAYDIPYLAASSPTVIIQQTGGTGGSAGGGGFHDDDDDDHDDDGGGEHDDDDD